MNEQKKDPFIPNNEEEEVNNQENVTFETQKQNNIESSIKNVEEPIQSAGGMEQERVQTQMEPTAMTVEDALAREPFQAEEISNPEPVMDSYQKEKTEPRKEKSKMLPIVIGMVVLLIGILAILYFVLNNSKNLFLSAINKEYTELAGNISGNNPYYEDAKKSSMVTSGTANIKVDDVNETIIGSEAKSLLEELNKLSINYTYGLDYKNKNLSYLMGITYDKKDMLNVNFYGKEKNMYVELKNLFSKYINIPYEEFDAIFENPETSVDDVKMITKTMKDAFLNALDAKDFKKTKETIKIGNKDEKTKKISYTINKENAPKLVASIVDTLKKDKKFISTLVKYSESTEKEIKEALDETVKTSKSANWADISLSIYFKGITSRPVQYELKESDSGAKVVYQKNDKEKKFIIMNNETEIMTFVNEQKTSKQSKTTIAIPSLDIEGIIEKNETDTGDVYDITFQDSKDTFKITGKYIESKKKTENTTNQNIDLVLKMEAQNNTIASFEVVSNATTTIGKAVEIPENLSNSIEVEKMTEVETNEILTNMMKNETLMNFINIFTFTQKNNAYNE